MVSENGMIPFTQFRVGGDYWANDDLEDFYLGRFRTVQIRTMWP